MCSPLNFRPRPPNPPLRGRPPNEDPPPRLPPNREPPREGAGRENRSEVLTGREPKPPDDRDELGRDDVLDRDELGRALLNDRRGRSEPPKEDPPRDGASVLLNMVVIWVAKNATCTV